MEWCGCFLQPYQWFALKCYKGLLLPGSEVEFPVGFSAAVFQGDGKNEAGFIVML